MKILLIGLPGFNRGDDAIAIGLLDNISAHLPKAIVTYTTQRVGKIIYDDFSEFVLSRKSIKYHARLTKEIISSDLVIIGGGSIIQDDQHYSIFRGVMSIYLEVAVLTKIFNKRLITAPIGIDDLTTKSGRKVAKYILGQCEHIFTRDEKSLHNYKTLFPDRNNVTLSADPAFSLKPILAHRNSTLVIAPALEGKYDKYAIELNGDAIKLYLQLNPTNDCIILCMDDRLEEDAGKAHLIKQMLPIGDQDKVRIVIATSLDDARRYLLSAKCVIAMRLHAVILSYSHTPILCLSRGSKTKSLCGELSINCIELSDINCADKFRTEFEKLFRENSSHNSPIMSKNLNVMKQRFLRFQDYLHEPSSKEHCD